MKTWWVDEALCPVCRAVVPVKAFFTSAQLDDIRLLDHTRERHCDSCQCPEGLCPGSGGEPHPRGHMRMILGPARD